MNEAGVPISINSNNKRWSSNGSCFRNYKVPTKENYCEEYLHIGTNDIK